MWLVFAPSLVVIILTSTRLIWKWLSGLPLPFERTQWDAQRTGYEQDFTRHRMADGLIASKALIGKSPEEIVTMLGETDSPNFGEHWHMFFVLGPCRHLVGIDTEFLAVHFDHSGKASEAAIVED